MDVPHLRSTIESHPEFYADIIAAGGLAAAMAQTAAVLGLEIGPVEPAPDSRASFQIPSPLLGRAALTILARGDRRLFMVDNHESGIACARGRTTDLAEAVRAAATWFAGGDPHAMKAAAAFIELPLAAEARASGSAQTVVEVNWQLRRERWSRQWEYHPDGWREPRMLTALRALLDAAYAEPRLRRLYAVTSHYNLWFSQCTEFPFARVSTIIEPGTDGRYRVLRGKYRDDGYDVFDAPDAVAACVAERLPPACGDAILGTAADLPEWLASHPDSTVARYVEARRAAATAGVAETDSSQA